jgi:aminopeptidase-like protein
MIDNKIYNLGKKIFRINRSITGNGLRKTLFYIKTELKNLKIFEIKSGTKVYDWNVPPEWNVKKAYVEDKNKKKIIDIKNNNLHLVGYSIPRRLYLKKKDLLLRIHTLEKQPEAIPYITSYYKKYWGFCASYNLIKKIKKNYSDNDKFFINIESSFKKKGSLTYGELLIPGRSKQEILISTYICHPQMANNELSGPMVSIALAKYFKNKVNEKSLRFIFIPETIGSITFLKKNINKIKKNIIGGYVLSCIGDERSYSFMPTKYGNSISDIAAKKAFKKLKIKYKQYSFLERGSDERQFNSPGIDLPVASILRSKYGEYPEYHTSLDSFNLVTKKGLNGGFKVAKEAIEIIMNDIIPVSRFLCEPKLQKKNLYESLSTGSGTLDSSKIFLNFLQYADGKNNIVGISKYIKQSLANTYAIYSLLVKNKLLKN